jgi:hypothetical protein
MGAEGGLTMRHDLETLAIQLRQLASIAASARDNLDALSDPHFALRSHAHKFEAVESLVRDAMEAVAYEARKGLTDEDRADAAERCARG